MEPLSSKNDTLAGVIGAILFVQGVVLAGIVALRYVIGALQYNSLLWWNWPNGFWH